MNLVEGILQQCNRVRDLDKFAEEVAKLPNTDMRFARAVYAAAIQEGEAALGSGDVVRMLAAYKQLEGCS